VRKRKSGLHNAERTCRQKNNSSLCEYYSRKNKTTIGKQYKNNSGDPCSSRSGPGISTQARAGAPDRRALSLAAMKILRLIRAGFARRSAASVDGRPGRSCTGASGVDNMGPIHLLDYDPLEIHAEYTRQISPTGIVYSSAWLPLTYGRVQAKPRTCPLSTRSSRRNGAWTARPECRGSLIGNAWEPRLDTWAYKTGRAKRTGI